MRAAASSAARSSALTAAPARALAGADAALLAQRGHLLTWCPVFLGAGIGLWFGLGTEPGRDAYLALSAALAASLVASRSLPTGLRPVLWAAALVAAGTLLAGARAHLVAAPVLEFRYYGPVEGRIVGIDRSASDRIRLTLDGVRLDRVPPGRVPGKVRVSLHGDQRWIAPVPGQRVMMTAHLAPPSGPAEPGGFDFQRHAWFQGIGAVGYTRSPVLVAEPAARAGAGQAVFALRMRISGGVQAVLPGEAGAFAAAILTGDRSGIGQASLEALRKSNLAHLLAISGLHMGLLTGFVFAAIRLALAAVPPLALRLPGKKIAALGALAAGAFYLALSGGNVATERAFIMVAVVLAAVLADRRALTLRAVAIAATIVLILQPEALLGPGFQMSFAATTALVAVFAALRGAERTRLPRWLWPAAAVVVSSAVAGAATAPYAAAHFNQVSHLGLIANLLSVPLMGVFVMPCAVLAALLWPLGLSWLALVPMGWGLDWILFVAGWISGIEGAVGQVPTPPVAVLPLLTLGCLAVVLWQGRGRWLGLAPAALAMGLWAGVERPALLVSHSGGLIGLMTEEGRALGKPRGDGFAASIWLENDGDGADQAEAAARAGLPGTAEERVLVVGGLALRHVTGRGAAERARCDGVDVLVSSVVLETPPQGCAVFDPVTLRETGALAVVERRGATVLVTARDRAGRRLWNDAALRARQ